MSQNLGVGPSDSPRPYQRAQAPAGAFGADTARALGGLGAAVSDAGADLAQHALEFQAINNKVAADERTIGFSQQADNLAIDYKANNMGMAAYENLDKAYTTLEEQRKAGSEGLSPNALIAYNSATRSNLARTQAILRDFAVGQRKESILKTSDGKVETAKALAAGSDDPLDTAQAVETIAAEAAYRELPSVLGWSPEQSQSWMRDQIGSIWQGKIAVEQNSGDYLRAQELFAQHKTEMTDDQIKSVSGALKVGANAFVANSFASSIAAGQMPADLRGEVRVGEAAPFLGAVNKREGTGDNPDSSAFGVGQFIKSTWLATMKKPQFASVTQGKSEAQILALRSDPTIGNAAILAYAEENKAVLAKAGLPVNSATLGLAHGFGPGDAIKILRAPASTPVSSIIGEHTAKINRVNDMTAAQLRAQFKLRFGEESIDAGQPTGQAGTVEPPPRVADYKDPDQFQADMYAYIETSARAMFSNNPVLESQAIASAKARVNTQTAQLRADQQASGNRLLTAILERNIQDQGALTSAYPNAAADFANLSPAYQRTVAAGLHQNANEWNVTRQSNYTRLQGMMTLEPAKFAAIDLMKVDLPAGIRRQMMVDQPKAAKKAVATLTDNTTKQALNSLAGTEALTALGLTPAERKDSEEKMGQYYQLAGAIEAEVAAYHGVHGKAPLPGSKEMNSIIAQVTAKIGGKKGLFGSDWTILGAEEGTPAFQVPDTERDQIIAALVKEGTPTPNEQQIAARYRMVHRGR